MNRIAGIAALTLVIAVGLVAISSEAQIPGPKALPKSGIVVLKSDAKVGDLIFQKGSYHVYCDHSNERHMMVFTRLDPKTKAKTRDITMVPCDMKAASGPITTTGILLAPSPDGIDEMKQVSIKGDSNFHVLLDR